jgi:hypothetical protein
MPQVVGPVAPVGVVQFFVASNALAIDPLPVLASGFSSEGFEFGDGLQHVRLRPGASLSRRKELRTVESGGPM